MISRVTNQTMSSLRSATCRTTWHALPSCRNWQPAKVADHPPFGRPDRDRGLHAHAGRHPGQRTVQAQHRRRQRLAYHGRLSPGHGHRRCSTKLGISPILVPQRLPHANGTRGNRLGAREHQISLWTRRHPVSGAKCFCWQSMTAQSLHTYSGLPSRALQLLQVRWPGFHRGARIGANFTVRVDARRRRGLR